MADETTTMTIPTIPPTTGDGSGAPAGQNAGTGNGGTNGDEGERLTLTTKDLKERLERTERAVLARIAKEQADKDAAAEAERLKTQGAYEQLAQKAQRKVDELEPQLEAVTTERDALREHLNNYIDRATKDWPADYRNLITVKEDALARWRQFEVAQKVVPGVGAPRTPGNTPSPAPRGNGQPTKSLVDQERERLLGTGLFSSG
jgi:small-conductance mechanosensitive channel